jgi:hypothetical protein
LGSVDAEEQPRMGTAAQSPLTGDASNL